MLTCTWCFFRSILLLINHPCVEKHARNVYFIFKNNNYCRHVLGLFIFLWSIQCSMRIFPIDYVIQDFNLYYAEYDKNSLVSLLVQAFYLFYLFKSHPEFTFCFSLTHSMKDTLDHEKCVLSYDSHDVRCFLLIANNSLKPWLLPVWFTLLFFFSKISFHFYDWFFSTL